MPRPPLSRHTTPPLLALLALAGCGVPPKPNHQSALTISPSPNYQPNYQQCLADLGARAASFTPLPDRYYGAGCSTLATVRLISLSADTHSLALTNLGPVACPLADAFAAWARFGADRAAQQILGSPLVKIETMGSYACRTIAGTSRLSAHATASAIDVSAFVLADGRRITVLGAWYAGSAPERQFLRTLQHSACRRFTAVLTPDYNLAHRDHIHLELTGNHICH